MFKPVTEGVAKDLFGEFDLLVNDEIDVVLRNAGDDFGGDFARDVPRKAVQNGDLVPNAQNVAFERTPLAIHMGGARESDQSQRRFHCRNQFTKLARIKFNHLYRINN